MNPDNVKIHMLQHGLIGLRKKEKIMEEYVGCYC